MTGPSERRSAAARSPRPNREAAALPSGNRSDGYLVSIPTPVLTLVLLFTPAPPAFTPTPVVALVWVLLLPVWPLTPVLVLELALTPPLAPEGALIEPLPEAPTEPVTLL